jgi:hypothetical protein
MARLRLAAVRARIGRPLDLAPVRARVCYWPGDRMAQDLARDLHLTIAIRTSDQRVFPDLIDVKRSFGHFVKDPVFIRRYVLDKSLSFFQRLLLRMQCRP